MNKKEIIQFGILAFNGEKEKFEKWLNKSKLCFNIKPVDLLKSESGREELKKLLSRLLFYNKNKFL